MTDLVFNSLMTTLKPSNGPLVVGTLAADGVLLI